MDIIISHLQNKGYIGYKDVQYIITKGYIKNDKIKSLLYNDYFKQIIINDINVNNYCPITYGFIEVMNFYNLNINKTLIYWGTYYKSDTSSILNVFQNDNLIDYNLELLSAYLHWDIILPKFIYSKMKNQDLTNLQPPHFKYIDQDTLLWLLDLNVWFIDEYISYNIDLELLKILIDKQYDLNKLNNLTIEISNSKFSKYIKYKNICTFCINFDRYTKTLLEEIKYVEDNNIPHNFDNYLNTDIVYYGLTEFYKYDWFNWEYVNFDYENYEILEKNVHYIIDNNIDIMLHKDHIINNKTKSENINKLNYLCDLLLDNGKLNLS